MHFGPFYLKVPILKPNSRKKGILIIMGPLRNLNSTFIAYDSMF